MTQATLFDINAGRQARDEGMGRAAERKQSLLDHARKVAKMLAKQKGIISADDVSEYMEAEGISPNALGNASGSLFKGGTFVHVGYTQARRVQSHGRTLKTWRLR